MRRVLLIAAVVASLLPLASGQRMAARGGFAGGARFAGPRFGGPRFAGGWGRGPFVGPRGFSHGSFFFGSAGFGVGWGFGRPFFPRPFFPRRAFYPAYPYAYAGYYPAYAYSYPATYDYSGYSSNNSYYPNAYYEQSRNMSEQNRALSEQNRNISRELDRLSDEVDQLRHERESRATDSQLKRQEPSRTTMLIFRDKHVEEAQNYAVVGPTLWTFNESRAKKVPLANLDVEATRKLNDERGIEFVIPNTP